MAFIDNMMNKLTNAGQSTVQKAKDISELARLNATVSESENQIKQLYSQIGYEVCQAYLDNPLPEVAEMIEQVKTLHQTIVECKSQIKAINAAGSCPQCGTKITKGSVFCSGCGFKFPEAEAPQGSFCSSCGSSVSAGSAFCPHCGAKLN